MLRLRDGQPLAERPELLPQQFWLIQSVSELEALLSEFLNVAELFCDVETDGLHAYNGNRICGFSFSRDNDPNVYYVPVRHKVGINLPPEQVFPIMLKIIGSCKRWINHNVKFDAHMFWQELVEIGPDAEMVCTLTAAKLINSDRYIYGLKPLHREWLGIELETSARVKAYLRQAKEDTEEQVFSIVPPDILGDYACQDVWGNRNLFRFIDKEMPDQVRGVWATEIKLTAALFDAERTGMHVDRKELMIEKLYCIRRLTDIGQGLRDILGREFNPKSPQQMYDQIVNQFGLPILAYKDKKDAENKVIGKSPTFDKKALAIYEAHPAVMADPKMRAFIDLSLQYREEFQHLSLYVLKYLEMMAAGVLHPTYNQCVRTGRMSGSDPNPQQLNKRAKALIHPAPGMAFLAYDYSQIEYRIIIHYIGDAAAIKAYNDDPTTDFHQWVADLIGITRKGGKILNFGMAFGMGKAKLTASLKSAPEIIESISKEINAEVAADRLDPSLRSLEFDVRSLKRAQEVYAAYHENIPGLKRTSREASRIAERRGFVFNAYGRRRHLLPKFCHKAFNSVIQPSAADVMKERTVALAPRYNKRMRDLGISVVASVHDETLLMGPIEVMRDNGVRAYIRDTLEDTAVKFAVPILVDCGYSENSWAEASGDDGALCRTCFKPASEWGLNAKGKPFEKCPVCHPLLPSPTTQPALI